MYLRIVVSQCFTTAPTSRSVVLITQVFSSNSTQLPFSLSAEVSLIGTRSSLQQRHLALLCSLFDVFSSNSTQSWYLQSTSWSQLDDNTSSFITAATSRSVVLMIWYFQLQLHSVIISPVYQLKSAWWQHVRPRSLQQRHLVLLCSWSGIFSSNSTQSWYLQSTSWS